MRGRPGRTALNGVSGQMETEPMSRAQGAMPETRLRPGKPVLIGEVPRAYVQRLDELYALGYLGVLPWEDDTVAHTLSDGDVATLHDFYFASEVFTYPLA